MVRFWNKIYYFTYIFDYHFHLFCNKFFRISPSIMNRIVKDSDKRKKVEEYYKVADEIVQRPDFGISITRAGIVLNGLVLLLCYSTTNYYRGIFQYHLNLKIFHYLTMLVVTLVINHFLLFKKSKYLQYFKEFDKLSNRERKKWAWITSFVLIGILLNTIFSVYFMVYRFHS